MSRGTAIDLGLTGAYNDLFSTQAERDNAQRRGLLEVPELRRALERNRELEVCIVDAYTKD